MSNLRSLALAGLATLAAWAAASAPAASEILVLQSAVAGLKPGEEIKDGTRISVPSGQSVVVMLPSGKTRTLRGPFAATAGELSKGEVRDDAIWKQVGEMLRTGGTSEKSVGATRGIAAARPAAPAPAAAPPAQPFSWRNVPIDAEGDVCVEKGVGLALVRGSAASPLRLTLVDVAASQRAEVAFAAGAAQMPWPSTVPIKVGAFALLVPERPMRQVRLRILDPLPDAESTLRVLSQQRCQRQAESWLRGLAVAGR
jgi:hypothetical protein